MNQADSTSAIAVVRSLLAAGEIVAATEQLRRLLDDQPGNLEALILLGNILIRSGRFQDAQRVYQRALAISPRDVTILQALGGIHHQLGNTSQAQAHLEDATSLEPGRADLWYSQGLVQHAASNFGQAMAAYGKAIDLDPAHTDALAGRGKVSQVLGDAAAARADFDRALALDANCIAARVGLATRLELDGLYEDAAALLEPVIGKQPRSAEVDLAWARLQARLGHPRRARRIVEALLEATPSALERSHALFQLAELLDQDGDYGAAAECYREANKLRAGDFDRERYLRKVTGTMQAWQESSVERSTGEEADRQVVFIVGMPRSGTSLTEQILASHPAVHAAGERPAIIDLARRWQREDGVVHRQDLEPGRLSAAAGEYLDTAGAASGHSHITDKMPVNWLHLGLIQAMFPSARIVHCRRNPLDTALSCFFQDFSGRGLAWSSDLDDIALYHDSYRRLMTHWQSVCDVAMLDLDYESLVADPEAEIRRLLDYLGLPWDPACLAFHETGRNVSTASHAQVRTPLYRSSVGRAANYQGHLEFPASLRGGADG